MSKVEIRRLDLSGVETLIGWAKDEGWNPGLADAGPFHAADPQGFFGCFVDGVMSAGISAVRYGAQFGFIGLYIAHPDFRGKGHGKRVWNAGMAHLAGRTIGLDGVPEQQANYRSMGFLPADDTHRWSGRITGENDADILPLDDGMAAELAAFDRRHFPGERRAFLQAWTHEPHLTKVLVQSGLIAGYAVMRQCHEGYKIGPLFAPTGEDAMALLRACAAMAGDEAVHIDVPAGQAGFGNRLERLGFARGFRTTRMYHGPKPDFDASAVFGITSLELG